MIKKDFALGFVSCVVIGLIIYSTISVLGYVSGLETENRILKAKNRELKEQIKNLEDGDTMKPILQLSSFLH